MSLKSLLTAATLLASSSAALASPVTFGADASFSYGQPYQMPVVRDHRELPTWTPVVGANTRLPIAKPMPPIYIDDCNNTTLGGDASAYTGPVGMPTRFNTGWLALTQPTRIDRGREFIHVGAQFGRFNTVKLENSRGSSFISQVLIEYANGRGQVVHLNERLSAWNPCITIDLQGRNRSISRIVVYGSTGARSAYQVLAA